MTKRSRKSASGKANVVRRSSLKTNPVCARDPMSLGNAALRRNVRTTLLVSTTLSASLMAVAMLADPASAAIGCYATNPAASAASSITYSGDQQAGIICGTTQDLTVNTDGTGALGGNQAPGNIGNGSGLQIIANDNGSDGGLVINVSNADGIGTKTGTGTFQPVITNGIDIQLTDTSAGITLVDTVTVVNTGPIGTSKNYVGVNGIFVNSATDVSKTRATSAGVSGGTATNTVTVTNSKAIFSTYDGIRIFSSANANATNPGTGAATGGSATSGVVITNNTGGVINSKKTSGIYGSSSATADAAGGFGGATGGKATATTTITNAEAITAKNSDGLWGQASASAGAGAAGTGNAAGGTATAGVVITNNKGGVITSGIHGIHGASSASATANG